RNRSALQRPKRLQERRLHRVLSLGPVTQLVEAEPEQMVRMPRIQVRGGSPCLLHSSPIPGDRQLVSLRMPFVIRIEAKTARKSSLAAERSLVQVIPRRLSCIPPLSAVNDAVHTGGVAHEATLANLDRDGCHCGVRFPRVKRRRRRTRTAADSVGGPAALSGFAVTEPD